MGPGPLTFLVTIGHSLQEAGAESAFGVGRGPHSFPSAPSPAPRGGLTSGPSPAACQPPGRKRRADSGAARGTAASTCRLLASAAHQASNSFCSFTLALSMSSCKCSISTFRAFRRANIVLYLQWNQKWGKEGSRDQGEPQKPGRIAVVPEARARRWCVSPELGISVQRAMGSPRRLAIITGH